ncbi:hypothetical protein BVG16_22640 [Paenibacillus selenitireducens]|uniref:NodB homology domain-containing protein n=1 Tax=Paenibacillus selenitireducens TaxID=1324314 RepID=A0A1T2X3X3_9BACL|nr:polysaccharide deacetylase family protein [Paenibacillus selenitireducens]OPA74569.1 hypothetical protein BVG16_22640 [Paenibacillus selenitireducens]
MEKQTRWRLYACGAAVALMLVCVAQFGPNHKNKLMRYTAFQSPPGHSVLPRVSEKSPHLQHVKEPGLDYHDQVAVLMFHNIDPEARNNDSITPDQFRADLDELQRNHINFITLEQFRKYMQGGEIPNNAALITFDDGYESYYKFAYPILKERQLGGVCFVITGDLNGSAVVYTPHMTKEEIQHMTLDDPDMEVQPHTNALHYKVDRIHDALTGYVTTKGVRETKQQYLERIDKDTELSIEQLKPLNMHPIDSFAYPYGLYNVDAIRTLKSHGIRYAFTTKSGAVNRTSNPMLLPRINGGSSKITPEALYHSIEVAVSPPTSILKSILKQFLPA